MFLNIKLGRRLTTGGAGRTRLADTSLSRIVMVVMATGPSSATTGSPGDQYDRKGLVPLYVTVV